MTYPAEYFEYRISSKFIGEIQIVFAIIVLVSGIASTVSFYSGYDTAVGHDKDLAVGYITFSVLTVIVAVSDLVFSAILISATQKISLGRCLLWRGASIATLLLFGCMTIAFLAMMKSPSILLGFLPTLIFKPFGLWIVGGFISELRELENFPSSTNSLPPAKPTLSLSNPEMMKRTTTIFRRESAARPPSVVTKITPIPEEP